jgi:hypothetical protein
MEESLVTNNNIEAKIVILGEQSEFNYLKLT